MALPKRKAVEIAVDSSTAATPATPQFRVVPKEGNAPPATAATAKLAIKGLNLGGIKAAGTKTSEKPRILNPPPELIEVLTQFAEHKPTLTALEGTVKALSKQAGDLAKPEWFKFYHGRADAGSSMVVDVNGRDVSLVFQKRYATKADANALMELGVAKHFALVTTLKIDMEKVPEDQQQPLVDAIIAAAAEIGAGEAITAEQSLQPKPGIHANRHILFTPEQNMAIDRIIPLVAFPKL